jgi:hypothetical protein
VGNGLTLLVPGMDSRGAPSVGYSRRMRKVVHKVLQREWVQNSSERQVLVGNFPVFGLLSGSALKSGLPRLFVI